MGAIQSLMEGDQQRSFAGVKESSGKVVTQLRQPYLELFFFSCGFPTLQQLYTKMCALAARLTKAVYTNRFFFSCGLSVDHTKGYAIVNIERVQHLRLYKIIGLHAQIQAASLYPAAVVFWSSSGLTQGFGKSQQPIPSPKRTFQIFKEQKKKGKKTVPMCWNLRSPSPH